MKTDRQLLLPEIILAKVNLQGSRSGSITHRIYSAEARLSVRIWPSAALSRESPWRWKRPPKQPSGGLMGKDMATHGLLLAGFSGG